MATSTVLRVKRRLEDSPQDALVLVCKRIKTDSEETSPSLFMFRGTVDSQEPINVKKILPKTDSKLKTPDSITNIIQRIRKERKNQALENRYEVVNCSRGLNEPIKKGDGEFFDLVDLQHKQAEEQKDVQFAYDLYTAAKQDFDISMIDNLVCIENYETDLILGSYRDNGLIPSDDEADEDDDSNDENNWRNDYPDSEPSSIDEEDMLNAMKKCDIEDDLSSDVGEDQIYNEPPDIFNEDVKRYGAAYAEYKAKVLSEEPDLSNGSNFVYCIQKKKDIDEESIEGYKENSDDGFYYGEDMDTEQFKDQYADESEDDEYSPD